MLFQSLSTLRPHILSILLQLFTPPANAPPLHYLSPRTNSTTNNDIANTITIPGIYICSHPNWTGTCFTTYIPPSQYGQCGVITGGSDTDTGWWQSIGPDAGISVELYADRLCDVPLTINNTPSTGTGIESSGNTTLAQEGEGERKKKTTQLQLIWPGIKDLGATLAVRAGTAAGVDASITTNEEKYLAVKVWPYMGRYRVGDGEGLLDI